MVEPAQHWQWGVRHGAGVSDYDDEWAARDALSDWRHDVPDQAPQLVRRLVTVEPWVWVED